MSKNYSVGIVDDEPKALEDVVFWVSKTREYYVKFKSTNPEDLIEKIKNREFHILITDIDMPQVWGIELADLARENNIPVIISSAYTEYSIDGIRCGAVDFMIKPTRFKELKEALDRAKSRIEPIYSQEEFEDTLYFRTSGSKSFNRLIPAEIVCIEHKANISTIHLINGKVQIRCPLSKISEKLNFPKLMQIHKSFYVNKDFIAEVTGHTILLDNGITFTIGRAYLSQIHTYLSNKSIN